MAWRGGGNHKYTQTSINHKYTQTPINHKYTQTPVNHKYTATQRNTLQYTKNTAIRDTSSKCIQKDLILLWHDTLNIFLNSYFVFMLSILRCWVCNCVTQLKLYTGYKLSSSIFCCLWVSMSGIGNTRPNLHFFQYIQAYKPYADPVPCNTKQCQFLLTQYHQVPDSIALYWPSTCWYHL